MRDTRAYPYADNASVLSAPGEHLIGSMTLRRLPFTIALLMLAPFGAWAEAVTEIKWQDLIPTKQSIASPFQELTADQKYQVAMIASIRKLQAKGLTAEGDPATRDAEDFTAKLEKQGLDVEALLAQHEAFRAEAIKQGQQLVHNLDGQLIRMPGYLLPLEYSGKAVSEFLLVPFVGACIHVPPPPLNQIVFVVVDKPFTPRGIYTPVWVTGRISTKPTQKTLSLVDGTSNVNAGYFLGDGKVETYRK